MLRQFVRNGIGAFAVALMVAADSRGFGMLPDGTFIETPVPGNVLQLYGLNNYTYGGIGGDRAATYNPVN